MPEVEAAALMGWVLCAAWAYLLGSFPTAFVVGRWMRGQDIRTLGDGNIGAGNAGRLWGARIGLLVGAIDVCKGMTAALVAWWFLDGPEGPMLAGILAILGDAWPVYLQRRGGRGGAVAGGVLLAIFAWFAVPVGLVALAVLWLTRNTTLALAVYYILVVILTAVLALFSDLYSANLAAYALAVPVLVGVIHFLSLRRELRTS